MTKPKTKTKPPGQVLLSFDVEEFDVPLEYNHDIDWETQLQVSHQGLLAILSLLDSLKIRATFFTTAAFAQAHPALLRQMAARHEIASHGFSHGSFTVADLGRSKQVLETITQEPITGFRMARLQPVDDRAILAAGYQYNSSLNPTYLPGRYNHLDKPRRPFFANSLLNIPVSVTPWIRFPLFWLSFKNLPLSLYKVASQWTLRSDRHLTLYFHPWEFAPIDNFGLPAYMTRLSGPPLVQSLDRYLRWLQKKQAIFITYQDFLHQQRNCLNPPWPTPLPTDSPPPHP